MKRTDIPRSRTDRAVTVRVKPGSRSKVKFGRVTIFGVKPNKASVKDNVARSTAALDRVSRKLVKPGIRLAPRKDVPRYFVDENAVGVFFRELNGELRRGRLVDGKFQVLD